MTPIESSTDASIMELVAAERPDSALPDLGRPVRCRWRAGRCLGAGRGRLLHTVRTTAARSPAPRHPRHDAPGVRGEARLNARSWPAKQQTDRPRSGRRDRSPALRRLRVLRHERRRRRSPPNRGPPASHSRSCSYDCARPPGVDGAYDTIKRSHPHAPDRVEPRRDRTAHAHHEADASRPPHLIRSSAETLRHGGQDGGHGHLVVGVERRAEGLRSSPLRGGKSREAGSQPRGRQ